MTKYLLFFLLSFSAFAQQNNVVLSSYKLTSTDRLSLKNISLFFEIAKLPNGDFEVLVPESQTSMLQILAPQAELLDADISATLRKRLAGYKQQIGINKKTKLRYHSFDDVQNWMKDLEKTHPEIVKVINYGKTAGGLPLNAIRLTKNIEGEPAAKPALMITAATHGDELITTEVLMNLVNQILEKKDSDPRFAAMVEKRELFFIPVVNPDGFSETNRYEGFSDPNRSYPYPGDESKKPTPSIAGLIQFFETYNIVGSIDFHAYGEMIMYPWAYTYDHVEEKADLHFHQLTEDMAKSNRYVFGPIAETIYIARGSSCDYYFWKKGTISLAIEMGQDKIPDPSEFETYFESQAESTWRFIEAF